MTEEKHFHAIDIQMFGRKTNHHVGYVNDYRFSGKIRDETKYKTV